MAAASASLPPYALLLMAGYLAFLWSPVSVFTIITHDSLIFFDSTYRISNGLVPSSDFPTALGAAQLYLPAWAAWVIGGYGGSIELASVWVALGLGVACAAIGAQRMPVAITALLLGVVFLVTVPAAMLERWGGESQTLVNGETEILADNLSWAMFYNRWGWAALIPVFMVLVPRTDRTTAPPITEIAVLAAVLTFPVLAEGQLFRGRPWRCGYLCVPEPWHVAHARHRWRHNGGGHPRHRPDDRKPAGPT